jgi:hypothetical protein
VYVLPDRARIQDDINRGDVAAMNRDLSLVRRHDRGAERIRRRIRGDVFLPLAFYPYSAPGAPVPPAPALIAHPQYPSCGYFPSDPNHLYRLPQPASVTSAGVPLKQRYTLSAGAYEFRLGSSGWSLFKVGPTPG